MRAGLLSSDGGMRSGRTWGRALFGGAGDLFWLRQGVLAGGECLYLRLEGRSVWGRIGRKVWLCVGADKEGVCLGQRWLALCIPVFEVPRGDRRKFRGGVYGLLRPLVCTNSEGERFPGAVLCRIEVFPEGVPRSFGRKGDVS